MPASISDFMSQVNSHVGPTGARFAAVLNPDGTVQISRVASGVSAVICPRVIYNSPADTAIIGDGSGQSVSLAPAFIAGLN
ncbi:MAG: hypothetical protein K6U89_19710 [Chloroflexi bacterium]|jgi:hypothetical protein|nr:hypothetical protein [Chloroflexota bacterium]